MAAGAVHCALVKNLNWFSCTSAFGLQRLPQGHWLFNDVGMEYEAEYVFAWFKRTCKGKICTTLLVYLVKSVYMLVNAMCACCLQEIYTIKWSPTGPGSRNPNQKPILAR